MLIILSLISSILPLMKFSVKIFNRFCLRWKNCSNETLLNFYRLCLFDENFLPKLPLMNPFCQFSLSKFPFDEIFHVNRSCLLMNLFVKIFLSQLPSDEIFVKVFYQRCLLMKFFQFLSKLPFDEIIVKVFYRMPLQWDGIVIGNAIALVVLFIINIELIYY